MLFVLPFGTTMIDGVELPFASELTPGLYRDARDTSFGRPYIQEFLKKYRRPYKERRHPGGPGRGEKRQAALPARPHPRPCVHTQTLEPQISTNP